MSGYILLPVILPVLAGLGLLVCSFLEHLAEKNNKTSKHMSHSERRNVCIFTLAVLAISAFIAIDVAGESGKSVTLFHIMKDIPVYFHVDDISRLFVVFISIVWVLAGIYSCVYMEHEGEEKRFFGFYLMVYGVLVALDFSGNLVTFYLFYELMTLTSMPMVLHNGSRESIMAALKYLFYSMCGAYAALFGIFFMYRYCGDLSFTPGGNLNLEMIQGNEGILLIAVFAMLVGFGAKAGMFPLHAWLPTAHPVAPSPASAVLSGIIVKCGVLGIVRVVYYVVGTEFIRGTWVQTAWMCLTLLTVFMGSLLAFREPVFKKRLAYSTVSQISYILFGLAAMTPTAFSGAMLHTVAHAFIKCTLFLVAGVFIFKCGITRVEELDGIGKKMPKTLWCYTFASLALIGIPPTSGFISKWYLAQGALEAEIGLFRYLGPIVLLISALLTAGYLLPIVMRGFFPGKDWKPETEVTGKKSKHSVLKVQEPSMMMLLPLVILAAVAVFLGVFPNPLVAYVSKIAASLM